MSASLGFNCIKEYSLLKARIAPTCKPRWDCVDKQACYYIHMLHPCKWGCQTWCFNFNMRKWSPEKGGRPRVFGSCSSINVLANGTSTQAINHIRLV